MAALESPQQAPSILRLRHIFNSYGRLPGVWVGFLLTILANIILKGGLALIVAQFAGSVFSGDSNAFKSVGVLFVALGFAAMLNLLADYAFVRSTDRRYAMLVGEFYSSITARSDWYVRSRKVDSLRNVFRNHLDGTVGVVRVLRTDVVPFLCACGIPAVILGYFDWQIGFLVGFVVVLQVWFAIWSARHVSGLRKEALKAYNKLTLILFEHVKRLELLKVALALDEGRQQVESLAADEARLFWRRHCASFGFEFLKALLAAACFACVFWLIDRRFSGTQVSSILIIVAAMYLMQSMQTAHSAADLIARLSEKWSLVGSSLAALQGDITDVELQRSGGQAIEMAGRSIELSSVTYAYHGPSGRQIKPVFNGLNLRIEAGSHVAVVGDNGSGKTTLLHLLLRFDSVQSGFINANGINIEEIEEAAYYKGISYAPSGVSIMAATVLQNITLFDRAASMERIEWASELTGVSDFVREMPLGMDSVLGEDGGGLSAGQQQRIVLARALIRIADFYLFDEATSALDEVSSFQVVAAIREALKGKTVIFVTHSRRLAETFPRVLECNGGSFVEVRRG